MHSVTGIVRSLATLLLLFSSTLCAFAQETDPASPADAEAFPPGLYFRDENGDETFVGRVVLQPGELRALLKRQQQEPSVGPSTISSIEASGLVRQQHVEMQVVMTVVVNVEEWVQIPIRFPSWQIREFEALPPNPEHQSSFPGNADRDRVWHLKGNGIWQLRLSLIGEVRPAEPERHRMKLSLPVDSMGREAVITALQLQFEESIEADLRHNARRPPILSEENGRTVAQFWGLQQETEINWQPAVPEGETATLIRVPRPAIMELDLRSTPAALTSSQDLRIDGRPIERMSVTLPPGYDEVQITGRDDNGTSLISPTEVRLSEDRTQAQFPFRSPVRGDITLNFNLSVPVSDASSQIVVQVPDLEGVEEESGRLNIRIPRGQAVDDTSRVQTRRISADAPADTRHAVNAFNLISTQSRLHLRVSEIEPRFSVDPQLTLFTDGDRLLMQANFAVNVSQGSLDEVRIRWQDPAETGWQLQRLTSRLSTDDGESQTLTPEQSADQIRIPLGGRQPGRFTVSFRAFRNIQPKDRGRFLFSLPDLLGSSDHPTTVTLLESDEYSLSLTEDDGKTPFEVALPRDLSTLEEVARTTFWLVNESGRRVQLRRTRQTQEISATAVVSLEQSEVRGAIQVESRFEINVRHRDLSELRLAVPDGILPTVEIDGQQEALGQGRESGNETVWTLANATARRLAVRVSYPWMPQTQQDRLPLVLPSQGLESVTIGTNVPGLIRVNGDEDEGFQLTSSRDFVAAWQAEGFQTDAPLDVSALIRGARRDGPPNVVLRQTRISPQSLISTTTAVYSKAPRLVQFRVPADIQMRQILVNGERARDVDMVEVDGAVLYQVSPVSGNDADSLRISMTTQTPRPPHHHLISSASPVCPRLMDTPDWVTTIWTISTTDDTRLAIDPPDGTFSRWIQKSTIFGSGTKQDITTIRTALSGLPQAVQSQFWQEYNAPSIFAEPEVTAVTTARMRTIPVWVYSPSAAWLLAATLGLLLYGFLLFLHARLRMMLPVAFVLAAVFGVIIPPHHRYTLMPLVPAVLLALTAWGLRLVTSPDGRRRRPSQRRSVFTATRPQVAGSTIGSGVTAGSKPAV